jgi:riboflavin biosynthesis pyrimidine reductase
MCSPGATSRATISPVQRLAPVPETGVDDEAFVAAYAFPDTTPWVRASMVTSLDGTAVGPDGGSRSIASAADRRIFSLLRRPADVVMVGAGTIRAEKYRPSMKPLAIVSRSGHLPADLRTVAERTADMPRPVLLTSAAAVVEDWLAAIVDVVRCGDGVEVDLRVAIDELARRGLGRILCEGGPRLLGDLARADLVDEYAVSLSPLLVGAEARHHLLTVPGGLRPPQRLRVHHVLEEDGTAFLLLRRS